MFNENITGDLTDVVQSFLVPMWSCNLLNDQVPLFFRIQSDGLNQFANQSLSMSYGNYVRDLLRLYYCFDDTVTLPIMKLIMAWILHNYNDDKIALEISLLLETLTGVNNSTG